MLFLKNIQFTHLIKINGSLKEFNFRKSNGSLKTIFTVDTLDPKDPRAGRIVFNMHDTGSEWKIMQTSLPAWIIENESQLNESIYKELAIQDIYFPFSAADNKWQFSKVFSMLGFG